MPRDYKLYLEDILEAAQRIVAYVQGVAAQTEFTSNQMMVDAVLYNLQVIGEAVKQVPPEVRSRYPDVEWRKIGGLRDIIAHEYFGVNLSIIWDIVQNKVPGLCTSVAALLQHEE